jgi:hypothetical protein
LSYARIFSNTCQSMSFGQIFALAEVHSSRRQLVKRLVSHRARTQTIYEFTGYSRHRLETLRHRWGISADDRLRGPSPTSQTEFFRTARTIQEATTAALLCELLGVLRPARKGSPASRMVELGEHLCYVYEALHASFPHLDLEFEHLVLLARGLTEGSCLSIDHCTRCGVAILVDRLAARPVVCRPGCHTI